MNSLPMMKREYQMELETSESTDHLTPRQLELLRRIACSQHSHCYSPTIAELACESGISRSTVFEHIAELRRKGLLSGYPNRARSLRLTCQAHELLSGLVDHRADACSAPAGIPLRGIVAAGRPMEAIENVECLSFNSCFGSGDDIFALQVRGDSMVNADIHDGDYVVCRRTSAAEDGQLVIAVVDDEDATLKRFYKDKHQARLQPANDCYEPIYSDNCRIEAVVIGLVRRL
jgi:repressor LexA